MEKHTPSLRSARRLQGHAGKGGRLEGEARADCTGPVAARAWHRALDRVQRLEPETHWLASQLHCFLAVSPSAGHWASLSLGFPSIKGRVL